MLGDGPGEEEVGRLARGRGALRHHLEVAFGDHAGITILDEEATGDGADGQPGGARIGQAAGEEEAKILLRRDDGDRLVGGIGGDDRLGEDLHDLRRRLGVEGAVQGNDAAEGGDRVAAKGPPVGLDEASAGGDATGIGVLDDGDGRARRIELGDQLIGGIGVVDIVVGERLALDLAGRSDAGPLFAGEVERGLLVRVLAIAQPLAEPAGKASPGGDGFADLSGEPARDGRVIGGGAGEGLGGETAAELEGGCSFVFVEGGDERAVVVRIDDDRDMTVVLGGGANHRRPADVDVLDGGGVVGAGGDGRLEGIEVADEEVDRGNRMSRHRRCMGGLVADAEKAAVDRRMEGLNPAVHDLGKAGHLGDIANGEPGPGECGVGAAGRDDLDAAPGERLGEVGQAGLVEDGDQRAAKLHEVRRWALGRGNGHSRLR